MEDQKAATATTTAKVKVGVVQPPVTPTAWQPQATTAKVEVGVVQPPVTPTRQPKAAK